MVFSRKEIKGRKTLLFHLQKILLNLDFRLLKMFFPILLTLWESQEYVILKQFKEKYL